ncbi:MarR family transcriptional regulator [Microcoleus sp. F8_C2]
METQITYDYLESHRELICLSMKFAKLSNQQREVLKTLANKNNATNKEIATIMKTTHGTASSVLSTLRVEGWLDSTTSGRNAFWFFIDENVKTFVQWKLCEAEPN